MEDENALLVFSGYVLSYNFHRSNPTSTHTTSPSQTSGQTRPNSSTTEADSYHRLSLTLPHLSLSSPPPHFLRTTTEPHALDSFQNLLFSIARFHEYTGRYPDLITVVGYEMKRKRFVELHRKAVRWPAERFRYVGIDPEGEAQAARNGEVRRRSTHILAFSTTTHLTIALPSLPLQRHNGYLPYTADTYGCHPPLLTKRRGRNPFSRFHSYYTSAPELAGLLDWCPGPQQGGQTTLFPGALPWYTPPRGR